MGGYKKFKKQEKAKVKLKGKKLAEATNVTDTNFKVKKIIVKEQLKEHGEDELLSNKHLNFKELITRLTHHNVGVRKEGLAGIEQLMAKHEREFITSNLSELLKAIMTLTVQVEAEIRCKSFDLIQKIFEQVTTAEIRPLFEVAVRYFTCAITHIDPAIRSDSLRLLDIMLDEFPDLTVSHANILLPNFINLISQKDSTGQARTLSLNLDGKVTSEKWRARVIGRLNRFFAALSDHLTNDPKSVRTVFWTEKTPMYMNLYCQIPTQTKTTADTKCFPIKEFADTLMPLLLDIAAEAVPPSDDLSCTVRVEVAALLMSIVEVILHLKHLLESTSSQDDTKLDSFKGKWSNAVVSKLLDNRFPYVISTAAPTSRKRKREADQVLVALKTKSTDFSATLLNLKLCLIAFYLSNSDKILTSCCKFIKSSLRDKNSLRDVNADLLCECLEAASYSDSCTEMLSLTVLLTILVEKSIQGNDQRATSFLTTVALNPLHKLHSNKNLKLWLEGLPTLLTKPVISSNTISCMAQIANRKLEPFLVSFNKHIEDIIQNLPKLKITQNKDNEGKKLIISLLYWLRNTEKKDWILSELKKTSGHLIPYFSTLIDMKC